MHFKIHFYPNRETMHHLKWYLSKQKMYFPDRNVCILLFCLLLFIICCYTLFNLNLVLQFIKSIYFWLNIINYFRIVHGTPTQKYFEKITLFQYIYLGKFICVFYNSHKIMHAFHLVRGNFFNYIMHIFWLLESYFFFF